MIQYLCGVRGCDWVPLIYVAKTTSYLMPIVEADDPSHTSAAYDGEMLKIVLIIETGNAANAKE